MPAGAETLVQDGTVTLFAMGFLAVEVLALLLVAQRPPLPVIANGLSGLFLILALHAALLGQSLSATAIWLGLGGLAHLADLMFRLDR